MHQPMQGAHAQRVRVGEGQDDIEPVDLSDGEKAILRRLKKQPIELYWGRNGWVPDRLPKPAKRADFDRICKRAVVEIKLARLVLTTDTI